MLTILLTAAAPVKMMPIKSATPFRGEISFEAYNCEKIQNTYLVQFAPTNMCLEDEDTPIDSKPITAVLLQDLKATRHQGFKCSIWETLRAYDCGMFSHVTPFVSMNRDRAVHLNEEACQKAVNDGLLWTKNDYVKVKKRGVTHVHFNTKGDNWISQGGKGACYGESHVNEEGYMLRTALITVRWTLRVTEVAIINQDNKLRVEQEPLLLPCKLKEKSCYANEARYIWSNKPNEQCTAAVVNTFKAIEIKKQGKTIISGTNGDMIRLEVKGPVQLCGKNVLETNVQDIFVTTDLKADTWARQRPEFGPEAIQEYIADREQFLAHHIAGQLRQELKEDTMGRCIKHMKLRFRLTHRPDSQEKDVWQMGNGVFGKNAKHAFYVFSCSPVNVTPRLTNTCYEDLPVTDISTNEDWFMDPTSNMLAKKSISKKCNDKLPDIFKSEENKWIAVGTDINEVRAPTTFRQHTRADEDLSITSGLFGHNVLINLTANSHIRDTIQGMNTELTNIIKQKIDHNTLYSRTGLGEVENLAGEAVSKIWPSNFFKSIKTWINDKMELLTIIVVTVLIILLIMLMMYLNCCTMCRNILQQRHHVQQRNEQLNAFELRPMIQQPTAPATLPSLTHLNLNKI